MIHHVSGDILLTKAPAVAHGVSPNDPFAQGLARALREKWPMMHKDYLHNSHQTRSRPGELGEWGGFGVRIFNLLTQEGTFDHGKSGRATIANVNHCPRRLRHVLEVQGLKGIALPRLAIGVGGLAWTDVLPQIESHLGDLQTPVHLYTQYHPGKQAVEPGM